MKPATIALLGPAGTNSHSAFEELKRSPLASSLNGRKIEVVFCDTITDALKEFVRGHATHALVPIETSARGLVPETIDFLLKEKWLSYDDQHRRMFVTQEAWIPIEHDFLVKSTDAPEEVEEIYSHPEAFKQCRNSLAKLGMKKLFPTESTAAAARFIAAQRRESGKAAIASPLAAKIYGLRVVQKHLEDSMDNHTRFYLLDKE